MTDNNDTQIKPFVYDSGKPGPKLLVLGAIHGDEKCGTHAINEIMAQLESGDIKLASGKVTFVPVCNPRAFNQNVRYIDRNLNRDMVPKDKPETYEDHLANQLIPLLDDCTHLLDIHSYHVGGPVFTVINEDAQKYRDFANALNPDWIISGWTDAYLASAPKDTVRSPTEHIGTTERVYNRGAIDVTLECGKNGDPKAIEVAHEGILRGLNFLGMAATPELKPARVPWRAAMFEVFYADGKTTFTEAWANFQRIIPNTLIATRGDGGEIRSGSNEEVIILPRRDAPPGDEMFYRGRMLGGPGLA